MHLKPRQHKEINICTHIYVYIHILELLVVRYFDLRFSNTGVYVLGRPIPLASISLTNDASVYLSGRGER